MFQFHANTPVKVQRKISYVERVIGKNSLGKNWVNELQEVIQKRYPHSWECELPKYNDPGYNPSCSWRGINGKLQSALASNC